MKHAVLIAVILAAGAARLPAAEETLPALKDRRAPQTFEELWAGWEGIKELRLGPGNRSGRRPTARQRS